MSFEPVDVVVLDSGHPALPIQGVVVKVLSKDGKQVVGQATTDAQGLVQLLLPGNSRFQVRFFKFGVSFPGAMLVDVVHGLNAFQVVGQVYQYPSSTDNRLCMASGFFRTPTGGVARSVDMHFIPKWNPILLEGSPIMTERVSIRTNASGYAEISLVRFGQYDVTIEGMDDYQRVISVPDEPSVSLGDLLFPVVTTITFEETGPYTMPKGEPLVVTPHVYSSDKNELQDIASDVLWQTSDGQVITLNIERSKITLVASQPGTYDLTATRRDRSVIRIPNTPITGVPVQITVT